MSEEITENTQEIITASVKSKKKSAPQVVGPINDGMIGVATKKTASKKPVAKKSSAVQKKTASTSKESKPETVAIYSERNMTWNGVGKVYRGYNIVTKEEAAQWLTRAQCREATPQEVAKEFGLD